jgi:hypothetical protein
MNEVEREPTDFEIAQLIYSLRSSTPLEDVTDMIDHVRRQNYAAGKAAAIVDSSVKLPGRMSP